jgi:hypothetical protein
MTDEDLGRFIFNSNPVFKKPDAIEIAQLQKEKIKTGKYFYNDGIKLESDGENYD